MEKDNSRTLQQLKSGHTAQIKDIRTDAKMAEKLAAMGLVRGQFITRKKGSSPVVVNVSGTEVAIGRETAKKLWLLPRKTLFFLQVTPMWAKALFSLA